jgi:hypothetical protein
MYDPLQMYVAHVLMYDPLQVYVAHVLMCDPLQVYVAHTVLALGFHKIATKSNHRQSFVKLVAKGLHDD